jgi:hypothetical protein
MSSIITAIQKRDSMIKSGCGNSRWTQDRKIEKKMVQIMRRRFEAAGATTEDSTPEEDFQGVDFWSQREGRRLGVDAKISAGRYVGDIPFEVWSTMPGYSERKPQGTVGWSLDPTKITDIYVFGWYSSDGQLMKDMVIISKKEYNKRMTLALEHELFYKNSKSMGSGMCLYVRQEVFERLEEELDKETIENLQIVNKEHKSRYRPSNLVFPPTYPVLMPTTTELSEALPNKPRKFN